MDYIVITADIVKSGQLPEREKVQQKIRNILQEVNKEFRREIVVKFSFSGGDEFQGLIKQGGKVFTIVEMFQKELYPVKAYFGIGFGKLSTAISKTTVEMDGECFHRSRYALGQAKKDRQEVVFFTGNREKDASLNTVLLLISAIKSSWKEIHYRRTCDYATLGTLEKVAQKEKVSRMAISKTLRDAKYEQVNKAGDFISTQLQSWLSKPYRV